MSTTRPATLAEALAILKAIHKLSPAEERDIDEAINCIVAFDGITDEMVERALAAAREFLAPRYVIDVREARTHNDREATRAMLEAVIEGMKPMRSKAVQSESGAITDNDKRWRILEHGCQWVSWTPKGGETVSFDPRDVKYLEAMRASADATIEKHLAILRAGAEAMERRLKR